MGIPQINSSFTESDITLLQRIKERDEHALSLLYDRYSAPVYSTLMRMLRSVEDSENILLELFTNIWNNSEIYKLVSGSLLTTILTETRVRSLARTQAKGIKKPPTHYTDAVLPLFSDSASFNVIPGLADNLAPARILEILRQLDKDEQNILSLAYYEGYALADISHRLKLAIGTVSWALGKSLIKLRELIWKEKLVFSSHEKEYFELCAARAMAIPDMPKTEEFQRHLSEGCEICRSNILKFMETVAILPLGLPQLSISSDLKQRVIFTIRLSEVVKVTDESTETVIVPKTIDTKKDLGGDKRKPVKKFPVLYILPILLSAALIASIVYIIMLNKQLSYREYSYNQLSLIERISETVERKNDILQILTSSDLIIIPFRPYQANIQAYGKLFWDPKDTIAVLQTMYLPTVPGDKTYQFWAFIKGTYFSCGTFAVKSQLQTENFFMLTIPISVISAEPVNFIITLEKAGGAEAPIGTRYLSAATTLENVN